MEGFKKVARNIKRQAFEGLQPQPCVRTNEKGNCPEVGKTSDLSIEDRSLLKKIDLSCGDQLLHTYELNTIVQIL